MNGPTVDIVVTVQRDAQAARRCIECVLAAPNATPFELLVAVDTGIHAELVACAGAALRDPRVTSLRESGARDYADIVNRAVALHDDRDVVLLQSDAQVAGDWLDRLARHARAARVGVVGTFTNAAGVATYPRAAEANAVPGGWTPATLDAVFARVNHGESAALPGVHGPCLYLTRACVAAIGSLNAVATDDGYGSEIDFSVRAADGGWQTRVAGDVFVASDGEGSFGGRAARQNERAASSALARRHPRYLEALRQCAGHDPSLPLARAVDLARLATSPRPAIVFISHAWGGGIRRHMTDLAAMIGDRAEILCLEPANAQTVKLHWPRDGEGFAAWFRLPDDLPVLARTLRAVGAARLHFHHVHGLPRSILQLPREAGLPYDCTLHDYYAICPQYHLVDEHGRYCGEPDAAGCAACIARRPVQWDADIVLWRSLLGALLREADRVIAPSRDVATRIGRYFPGLAISVWPHPERAIPATRRIVRAVTLGNLSPEKGLDVVAACAQDARARGLPLTFRVLGSTAAPISQTPDVPLSIHGSYSDDALAELLAAQAADVLFFPVQVPETYSYTLSVALATGTPIVASALGAFPERLAGRERVRLLPWNAAAAQWNDALLDAAGIDAHAVHASSAITAAPPRESPGTDPDRYVALYLAPLTAPERPPDAGNPTLDARHFHPTAAERDPQALTLQRLFEAGALCGHAEARAELGRRAVLADAELAELRAIREHRADDRGRLALDLVDAQRELMTHRASAQVLEEHLGAARARTRELETSTAWRMTAPLRAVGHRAKRGAAELSARWRAARQLPRNAGLALTILRDDGPIALARRVARNLRRRTGFRPAAARTYRLQPRVIALAVPTSDSPAVSIVIPAYGDPLLTFTCLASVAEHTSRAFEVIVVDDASPQPLADALAEVTGVRVERNSENLGFVRTLQSRRSAGAWCNARVPQQRHDRHGRLARCADRCA